MADQNNRHHVMSEINVTPLVDVMLVLLIIFMITTPLLEQGIPIDLPQTKTTSLEPTETQMLIEITKNLDVFLGYFGYTNHMAAPAGQGGLRLR